MRLAAIREEELAPIGSGMRGREFTATVVVLRQRGHVVETLLEKRGKPPRVGAWSVPGGHLKPGETPEQAAVRELWEETRIKVAYVVPLESDASAPDRAVKDYAFATLVDPAVKVQKHSDALALQWVDIGQIPPLAFGQERLIYDAVSKLLGEHATVREALSRAHGLLASDLLLEYDDNPDYGVDKFKETVEKILSKKAASKSGLLIVFEGIDGAGKSLQVDTLEKWLKDQGYEVMISGWNSSDILHKSVKKLKSKKKLTPMLFCLLHAADLIIRYEQEILPALERNEIVICDRYIYTSMARDKLRGTDVKILDTIYEGLREPDVIFHATVPIHIAFARILKRKGLSYYGTGSDLHLADNYEDNYVKYEAMLDDEYHKILPKQKNYKKLDMNQSPEDITEDIKEIMADMFGIGKYAQEQPNR